MKDLYGDIAISSGDSRKRMALRVPAGTYRISRSVLLYPFSAIIGDGIDKTIIILEDPLGAGGIGLISPNATPIANGPTPEVGNECAIRTCDELGQAGSAIGSGSATVLPQNIFVSGVCFLSESSQTLGVGLKDIAKIEAATQIRFERVRFEGNWTNANGVNGGSKAVNVGSGGTGTVSSKLSFVECEYSKTAFAFNITVDNVSDINVVGATFDTHHRAVKLGFQDITLDPQGSGGSPELFRVSHSRFTNISEYSFDNKSSGIGNISSFNFYDNTPFSGTGPAVLFDTASQNSFSLSDTFENTDASICIAGKLNGPRIDDNSTSGNNLVLNTQDPFQIHDAGICGDLNIDGDLNVTGSIIVSGTIDVSGTASQTFPSSATPFTHTVVGASVSYVDGSHIIYEYGLEIGGVVRNGTLSVIHDGSPSSTTDLSYQDSFVEHGGPSSNTVTVFAETNVGNTAIDLKVEIDGLPSPHPIVTFNFRGRVMSIV